MCPTVYTGEALKHYQFGEDHPFGPHRYDAFMQRFQKSGLSEKVSIEEPVVATEADIGLFHSREYIDLVKRSEESGRTFLDAGDTPIFKGIYKAAATVVGTVLKAVDDVVEKRYQQHALQQGAKYFRARKPKKLVYIEIEHDRSSASKREYEIKQLSRADKMILIDSNHNQRSLLLEVKQ